METLEFDGSLYEGGGQILRVGVSLAIIKRMPVRIYNIRANRPKPGLANSHMTAMKLACELCNGQIEGNQVGSSGIHLVPNTLCRGAFSGDCGTAGSVTLMLQALLPPIVKSYCSEYSQEATTLVLKGGTDVGFSPPSHFTSEVLRPFLSKMGVNFDYQVDQRGFYPRGGGQITVRVHPVEAVSGVELLDQGDSLDFRAQIDFSPTRRRIKGGISDHDYISRVLKALK